MTINSNGPMWTLAGDSFQVFTGKTKKEKRLLWKLPHMVPVCDGKM
jgi:hypothetical protein